MACAAWCDLSVAFHLCCFQICLKGRNSWFYHIPFWVLCRNQKLHDLGIWRRTFCFRFLSASKGIRALRRSAGPQVNVIKYRLFLWIHGLFLALFIKVHGSLFDFLTFFPLQVSQTSDAKHRHRHALQVARREGQELDCTLGVTWCTISTLLDAIIVELRTPAMPVGVGGGKERGGFHLNLRTWHAASCIFVVVVVVVASGPPRSRSCSCSRCRCRCPCCRPCRHCRRWPCCRRLGRRQRRRRRCCYCCYSCCCLVLWSLSLLSL